MSLLHLVPHQHSAHRQPVRTSESTAAGSTVIAAAGTGRSSEVGTTSNTEVNNTQTTGTGTPKLPDPELCQKFMEATSGCTKNDGKACSGLFSLDHYIEL